MCQAVNVVSRLWVACTPYHDKQVAQHQKAEVLRVLRVEKPCPSSLFKESGVQGVPSPKVTWKLIEDPRCRSAPCRSSCKFAGAYGIGRSFGVASLTKGID